MLVESDKKIFVVKSGQETAAPQLQSDTLKRIPELDGLRGVAVLLVVSFHYINNQLLDAKGTVASVLCKATSFGWVGVDLFFILSGFLIGTILIANRGKKNYFKTFYIRRIVRIIPNYFLLLVVALIIMNIGFFSQNRFLTEVSHVPIWSYFFMVQNIFMGIGENMGNDSLSITWSIGVEEQFYLVFPLLVYFSRPKFLPVLLGIMIFGAILFRAQFDHWLPKYVLLPARLDGLSLGFLVAYLNQKKLFTVHRSLTNKIAIAALIISVLISGVFYGLYGDLGIIKHTIFGIAFSAMLVLALTAQGSWYGAFLRLKPLRWVGMISYSLYLFHYLILGVAQQLSGKNGIAIRNSKDVLVTGAAFVASLLVSWLIYQMLEKPMVKIGKRYHYN